MGRRLYVGNLPYTTGEAELQELFAKAGTVESVRVMRDAATGRRGARRPSKTPRRALIPLAATNAGTLLHDGLRTLPEARWCEIAKLSKTENSLGWRIKSGPMGPAQARAPLRPSRAVHRVGCRCPRWATSNLRVCRSPVFLGGPSWVSAIASSSSPTPSGGYAPMATSCRTACSPRVPSG